MTASVDAAAPPRPLRVARVGSVTVAVGLLLVLALAGVAARSGPWASLRASAPATVQPLPTQVTATPTAKPTLPPQRTSEHSDSGVIRVVAVLLAAFLAACLVAAAWLFWPRLRWRPTRWRRSGAPTAREQPAHPPGAVAEAVDRALLLIDDPDARGAVVRAWLLLGAAATAAGTPARTTETSRDYARRLAATQHLPLQSVERLAGLYREARFSAHDMRADQRDQARADLLALRSALLPDHASAANR